MLRLLSVNKIAGVSVLSALLLAMCAETPAQAAEQIGDARKIVNNVTGTLASSKRKLSRGDAVFRNERISARVNSSAQLVFKDGTRFVVGCGASAVLDKFVYAGASSGNVVFRASRGAFRFVTGSLPARRYKIVTPASTIGVRGTKIDGYVGRGGETIVVLLRGASDVCNRRGQCRTLKNRCDTVRVSPSGQFTTGRGLSARILGNNNIERAAFFMLDQYPLIRSIRAPKPTIRTCLGANQETPSGSDTQGRDSSGVSDGFNEGSEGGLQF
ncbi:MAG: FecR family protein [Hyphomicrobiales bacterium]